MLVLRTSRSRRQASHYGTLVLLTKIQLVRRWQPERSRAWVSNFEVVLIRISAVKTVKVLVTR